MKLGTMEIIVIFIVALLVIGPDKLPYYVKKLGGVLKEFKKASSSITKELREEVLDPLEEAQRPLKEALEPLTDLKEEIDGNLKSIQRDLTGKGSSKKKTTKSEVKSEPKAETEKAAVVAPDDDIPEIEEVEEIVEEPVEEIEQVEASEQE